MKNKNDLPGPARPGSAQPRLDDLWLVLNKLIHRLNYFSINPTSLHCGTITWRWNVVSLNLTGESIVERVR